MTEGPTPLPPVTESGQAKTENQRAGVRRSTRNVELTVAYIVAPLVVDDIVKILL